MDKRGPFCMLDIDFRKRLFFCNGQQALQFGLQRETGEGSRQRRQWRMTKAFWLESKSNITICSSRFFLKVQGKTIPRAKQMEELGKETRISLKLEGFLFSSLTTRVGTPFSSNGVFRNHSWMFGTNGKPWVFRIKETESFQMCICRGSLYIANPNQCIFIRAPDPSKNDHVHLRIKFVHLPQKKRWVEIYPPGNYHISHLWKIKIIDSKWTFQGIC